MHQTLFFDSRLCSSKTSVRRFPRNPEFIVICIITSNLWKNIEKVPTRKINRIKRNVLPAFNYMKRRGAQKLECMWKIELIISLTNKNIHFKNVSPIQMQIYIIICLKTEEIEDYRTFKTYFLYPTMNLKFLANATKMRQVSMNNIFLGNQ